MRARLYTVPHGRFLSDKIHSPTWTLRHGLHVSDHLHILLRICSLHSGFPFKALFGFLIGHLAYLLLPFGYLSTEMLVTNEFPKRASSF